MTLSQSGGLCQRFGRPVRTISGQHSSCSRPDARRSLVFGASARVRMAENLAMGGVIRRRFSGKRCVGRASSDHGFPHSVPSIHRHCSSSAVSVGIFDGVAVRFIFRRRSRGLCDDGDCLRLEHRRKRRATRAVARPHVMSAIAASGGLDEAFSLPAMLILPAIALGGIGGLVGAGTKRFWRSA